MWRAVLALVALLAAGAVYFVRLLLAKRAEVEALPQPPMKSKLMGHLYIADECRGRFPKGAHPHLWAHYIRKRYDLGDFFYVDWWPIARWLYIADPELVSQYVTTTQCLQKSPLETDYLNRFLGDNNMVGLEGSHWKFLRGIFNPGFSAGHLMTLAPYIVDASMVFRSVLLEKTTTGDLFELEEYATRLTIDIIGKVVLDSDFDSQKAAHPIVETFRHRVGLMPGGEAMMPWQNVDLLRPLKLWWNGRKLDRLIGEELDRKIAVRQQKAYNTNDGKNEGSVEKSSKDRKRSAVDLAIDAYQKESAVTEKGSSTSTRGLMSLDFRRNAIDSIKTFIFAGHDTTASTIAYIFYILHFHPAAHAKILTEFDGVFGVDASSASIASQLKDNAHLINKLDYTTAVMKETLRLFPPASTLRHAPATTSSHQSQAPNLTFTDPHTKQQYPLTGWTVWPTLPMIHRNERFFPQPVDFIPERFLGPRLTPFPDAELYTAAGKDAWRPFEKGPRNCIGQELAMIETKIILALTLRELDFEAEFDGAPVERWAPVETYLEFNQTANSSGGDSPGEGEGEKKAKEKTKRSQTVEGHRCYQILRGSAKPNQGMPGRIKLRGPLIKLE